MKFNFFNMQALFWKVLLLAAVICCVTCQQWYLYSDEPRQIEAKRGAQKYCGRILDDTLKFICRGKYNERFPSGKKRATGNYFDFCFFLFGSFYLCYFTVDIFHCYNFNVKNSLQLDVSLVHLVNLIYCIS